MEIANRLGYVPSYKKNTTETVGLAISRQQAPGDSFFLRELIFGFFDEAENRQKDFKLISQERLLRSVDDLSGFINQKNISALVLMSFVIDAKLPIPFVAYNYVGESKKIPSVGEDAVAGIHQALKYLKSLGHKSVAFLGHNERLNNVKKQEYFTNALRLNGLDAKKNPIWLAENAGAGGGEARILEAWRSGEKLPTAVIASTEELTLGALAAFHSLGVKMPQDISLIGTDDSPHLALHQRPVTIIRQPTVELVRQVFILLENQKKLSEQSPVQLPNTLVIRMSCGAVGK